MVKNIVNCSDGTGSRDGKTRRTNVWRIFNAVYHHNRSINQITYYDDGVETKNWRWVRLLVGAFGWGLSRNIREASAFFAMNYEPGGRWAGRCGMPERTVEKVPPDPAVTRRHLDNGLPRGTAPLGMDPRASLRVAGDQWLQVAEYAAQAQGANAGAQGKRLVADVHDVQALQFQVPQRHAHGGGEARRRGVLEFESEAAGASHHQQVKLGSGMRRPEEALPGVGVQAGEYFAHGEAFPRGADLGMSDEVGVRTEVEQAVQQTAIGNIDFGGFDLTFSQIFKPRLKLPDDQGGAQGVEITPHGRMPDAKGAGQFGAVPYLTVIVGQHGPEALQGDRRHANTKLGQVSFQKGADEILPPRLAFGRGAGQIRRRESAPHPEPF